MKKVLIIEDDKEISELLEIHLKDLDCEVTKAFDGKTGLNIALSNQKENEGTTFTFSLPLHK